jgi:hypothetical protein
MVKYICMQAMRKRATTGCLYAQNVIVRITIRV